MQSVARLSKLEPSGFVDDNDVRGDGAKICALDIVALGEDDLDFGHPSVLPCRGSWQRERERRRMSLRGTPLRNRRRNPVQRRGLCGIGDPDEDDLVSSGLQFAGQGGHRVEVTGKRHTNKTNFHR